MPVYIDHCAFLVEKIEDALSALAIDCQVGEIDTFASEGTRELYLHHHESSQAAILLMQAAGEGPYLRALHKRGPGLHHICIRVPEIAEFVEEIAGRGFLLHPSSLKSISRGVVYLCRPGIPFFVEVEALSEEHLISRQCPGLVSSLGLPLAAPELKIVQSIFADFIFCSADLKISLRQKSGELLTVPPSWLMLKC